MFLQMYLGDQIQNYTDKFLIEGMSPDLWGCSQMDVGFISVNSYPIGILSVNNMNSTVPESKYTLTYFPEANIQSVIKKKMEAKQGYAREIRTQSSDTRLSVLENNVLIHGFSSHSILTVYDINGRILTSQNIEPGENSQTMPFEDLGITDSGVYILTLQDGNEIQTIKVVI